MARVLGRTDDAGERGRLGSYRAVDGSRGAPVWIDLDRPHAALVVGKRGYGKSYTLGVLAEELATADGVSPVVLDPMGVFDTLSESTSGTATVVASPTVPVDELAPRSWCRLLGLSPEEPAGTVLWRVAAAAATLADMRDRLADLSAESAAKRAVANHLSLAESWGIFDSDGLTASELTDEGVTVVDLSGLAPAPMNALARAIARGLYDFRVDDRTSRLPWLLVDEAHAFFDGLAAPALRTLLTRGRQPGVSLVTATQRPASLPDVAISQADLVIAHRLTARDDLNALARVRPSYVQTSLVERMPTGVGDATVVDDATEDVHAVAVRERETPHGGESPRANTKPPPGG